MSNIEIFQNEEFGEIRTIEEEGKVLFCANDVAKALGYTNPNKAVNDHCRAITKCSTPISGKMQEINFIPEGDVYRLITHSKLPSAEKFESWVFDEVLPAIRKTGGYIVGEKNMSDEELLAQALIVAQRKLTERTQQLETVNAKLEEAKPKIVFADAVSASKTSILIGDLAKILRQNGVEIGQKRLFDYMRNNGYLMKNGTSKNLPTQRYMEQGLFEIKEHVVVTPSGEKQNHAHDQDHAERSDSLHKQISNREKGGMTMDDNKIITLTLTKHEVASIQASLMTVATELYAVADACDDDMEKKKVLESAITLVAITSKIGDQRKEQEGQE